jgi:hypothetical protein
MDRISNKGGLFARQKANQKFGKIMLSLRDHIKRGMLLVFMAGIFATLSSCDEKTNGQHALDPKNDHTAANDSLNGPKVNIKVNRSYDDKGNLIGFDSAYSSFYSNVKGDTTKMDSLMHRFDRYFSRNHSSFFDNQFNQLFFNDSMRYPDFFHNDFFMKRYELNDDYLRGTMRRMDSIKNRFFYEQNKKGKDPQGL